MDTSKMTTDELRAYWEEKAAKLASEIERRDAYGYPDKVEKIIKLLGISCGATTAIILFGIGIGYVIPLDPRTLLFFEDDDSGHRLIVDGTCKEHSNECDDGLYSIITNCEFAGEPVEIPDSVIARAIAMAATTQR